MDDPTRTFRLDALAKLELPGMTQGMFENSSGQNFVKRGAPMGRAGDEHELDGALLFLASEASSYVTGQTLFVDGGWTII